MNQQVWFIGYKLKWCVCLVKARCPVLHLNKLPNQIIGEAYRTKLTGVVWLIKKKITCKIVNTSLSPFAVGHFTSSCVETFSQEFFHSSESSSPSNLKEDSTSSLPEHQRHLTNSWLRHLQHKRVRKVSRGFQKRLHFWQIKYDQVHNINTCILWYSTYFTGIHFVMNKQSCTSWNSYFHAKSCDKSYMSFSSYQ